MGRIWLFSFSSFCYKLAILVEDIHLSRKSITVCTFAFLRCFLLSLNDFAMVSKSHTPEEWPSFITTLSSLIGSLRLCRLRGRHKLRDVRLRISSKIISIGIITPPQNNPKAARYAGAQAIRRHLENACGRGDTLPSHLWICIAVFSLLPFALCIPSREYRGRILSASSLPFAPHLSQETSC